MPRYTGADRCRNSQNTLTDIEDVKPIYLCSQCVYVAWSRTLKPRLYPAIKAKGGKDFCVSEDRVNVVGSGGWEELTL